LGHVPLIHLSREAATEKHQFIEYIDRADRFASQTRRSSWREFCHRFAAPTEFSTVTQGSQSLALGLALAAAPQLVQGSPSGNPDAGSFSVAA
jgi:hypothetical protein